MSDPRSAGYAALLDDSRAEVARLKAENGRLREAIAWVVLDMDVTAPARAAEKGTAWYRRLSVALQQAGGLAP